ncbi:MAG: DUF1569 domain-containing protein [Saprospiraceae bacterium]|nr:DUF1569 domain-containing protein [Saprospiraceae bacterium]
MALPNIFTKEVTDGLIHRINLLQETTKPIWGKMTVSQMLAHCSVTYEMVYDDIHPKPNALMAIILKILVKKRVVNESPYPHNLKTAPQFIIKGDKDFSTEKNRLIMYLNKTMELGEKYFDGKKSHSFGKLHKIEWNNMFYKHLNHHLTQFGV